MLVDVATGWVDLVPVPGHGVQRVKSALHGIRQRLPFVLRELHTDNGAEFLNKALLLYCQEKRIHFTRGRVYKKNDQAYVEQKNGSVVRRLVGYDRYSSTLALHQLEAVYQPLRAYLNAFQPSQKLLAKQRQGARLTKRYDCAQTPLQRLARLAPRLRAGLETRYRDLNPVALCSQIDQRLQALWKLADRASPR